MCLGEGGPQHPLSPSQVTSEHGLCVPCKPCLHPALGNGVKRRARAKAAKMREGSTAPRLAAPQTPTGDARACAQIGRPRPSLPASPRLRGWQSPAGQQSAWGSMGPAGGAASEAGALKAGQGCAGSGLGVGRLQKLPAAVLSQLATCCQQVPPSLTTSLFLPEP